MARRTALPGRPLWQAHRRIARSALGALMVSLTVVSCGAAPGTMANRAAAPMTEAIAPADLDQQVAQASSPQAPPRAAQPQLIKTVALTIKANSVTEAIAAAQGVVSQNQGDVLTLNDRRTDTSRIATMTFRIPADRLDRAVEAVVRLGYLQNRSLQAEDVTDQLVDADARLRNLRKTEESLLALLQKSGSIRDILAVNQQMSQTRQQIEQIDAQLKNLRTRVAYSTVNLTIEQSVAGLADANPVTAQLAETWGRATQSVGKVTIGLLKFGLWLLAYTPYWLILAAGIWAMRRWAIRRSTGNRS